MNAPLTSPTRTTSSSNYFQTFPTSSKSSSAVSTSSTASTSASQPAAQKAPQRSSSQDETSPFLNNFNLVAEAAKRAQMACLMRDMEGCDL